MYAHKDLSTGGAAVQREGDAHQPAHQSPLVQWVGKEQAAARWFFGSRPCFPAGWPGWAAAGVPSWLPWASWAYMGGVCSLGRAGGTKRQRGGCRAAGPARAARSRACFAPPGFCCMPPMPVSCSGAPNFSLWGPKTGATCGATRHVLIERKAKRNAGGLHVLLIIMWPDTTLAILLLQLLLN
jgi:hypothetical protein